MSESYKQFLYQLVSLVVLLDGKNSRAGMVVANFPRCVLKPPGDFIDQEHLK